MLRSEHVRILGSAQERYDKSLMLYEQRGYWRGMAHSLWFGVLTSVCCSAAFYAWGVYQCTGNS